MSKNTLSGKYKSKLSYGSQGLGYRWLNDETLRGSLKAPQVDPSPSGSLWNLAGIKKKKMGVTEKQSSAPQTKLPISNPQKRQPEGTIRTGRKMTRDGKKKT